MHGDADGNDLLDREDDIRPERILQSLPADWGAGYPNVEICCTCENQRMADKRLPIFLELPLPNKSIIHEAMLQCVEYGVPFSFHQTGARLRRGTKIYEIPREHQHEQAHKAHLDYNGVTLPALDDLSE